MAQKAEQVFRKEIAMLFSMLGYRTQIQKTIRGRSGMSHKVDIVAEKFEIPIKRLIIIKCKIQEVDPLLRPDEVLQFWARVFDVRADRGIIVTTCGLTEDAIKFANHYGINIIKGKSLEDLKRNVFQGMG